MYLLIGFLDGLSIMLCLLLYGSMLFTKTWFNFFGENNRKLNDKKIQKASRFKTFAFLFPVFFHRGKSGFF